MNTLQDRSDKSYSFIMMRKLLCKFVQSIFEFPTVNKQSIISSLVYIISVLDELLTHKADKTTMLTS